MLDESPHEMETLQQAIRRLEGEGFTTSLLALSGGRIGTRERSYAPRDLVVEAVVRFEGLSDPEDEAVLFALRAPDGLRGTFVAAYGPQMEPDTVAVVEGLEARPRASRREPA